MSVDILMPALSPTMEEGTLAKWLKSEGDTISSGDIIAEIETDKATMEVEAVDEGTIGKILVAEGTENVKVNARIAVILEDGESADAMSETGSATASVEKTAEQPEEQIQATAPVAAQAAEPEAPSRSEEHTSELQSRSDIVCRLLLEKKKIQGTREYSMAHRSYLSTRTHNSLVS